MPLKIQQDGSVVGGQPNTVIAAWWNDYHDLLTGVMTDQDVTLHTDLILVPLGGNPAAPTAAAQAGTGLGVGSYTYGITFLKQGQSGESLVGTTTNVTTTSGNQAVGLSAIPVGPAGTIARNVYRSKVGGGTLYYVAQLANNTATTYVDTTPDASLTVGSPPSNNYGGTLIVKDGTGTIQAIIAANGAATFNGAVQANSLVSTNNLTLGLVGNGGSWVNAIEFTVSGTPTVAKSWAINYDGASGDLIFYNNTDGKTRLQISPNGIISTYPNTLTGTMASLGSAGGGAAGNMIWVGTSDPGAVASEGDIWIKA